MMLEDDGSMVKVFTMSRELPLSFQNAPPPPKHAHTQRPIVRRGNVRNIQGVVKRKQNRGENFASERQ